MSDSAFTPRVRFLAVCDEAIRSEIEEDVYTLEGVRYRLSARAFPCLHTLRIYLQLSYPRKGRFAGRVRVEDDEEGKILRLAKFVAQFDEDTQLVAIDVDLGECVFPAPKVYWIKVEFTSHSGGDVLKSETPFSVLEELE